MKKLCKKNPFLFIGLLLPLLMILVFGGVPFVASFVVEPPQYDFIYSTNSHYNDVKLKVVEGKLILSVHNPDSNPREMHTELYLVHVSSKKAEKLRLAPFDEKDLRIPPLKNRDFIIEGVSLKSLDPSKEAPDGYIFEIGRTNGMFPFFLFDGNNNSRFSLKKSGRVYNIATEGYWASNFEGWVIQK